jgi:hypothetical protein
VSTDLAKLWNELTNGSRNFSSPTKANVTFIVKNTRHNKKSPTKGSRLMGQSTPRNASQVNKILRLKSPSLIFLNVFGYPLCYVELFNIFVVLVGVLKVYKTTYNSKGVTRKSIAPQRK